MEETDKARAEETLCQACEDAGIKVSAWQDFEGWTAFVNEEMDEVRATEQARTDLDVHARNFGKYLVIEKEDPATEEEIGRRARAKLANKIYRKVCEDAGMTFCFFSGFSAWHEYIDGKLDDREFYEKARLEAVDLVKESARDN